MWKVYKRTCPNGKVYIGVTKRTLEERMSGGYVNNKDFALDIIKYGKNNIISEVLEEHEDYDTAIEREWYYINLYKDNCYNKIGNSKRYVRTQSSYADGLHSFSSTEPSPQTRKTYDVPIADKPLNRRVCPISVYDLNGNYIATYASAKIASIATNVNHGDIVSCCKGVKSDGKRKYQANGYIFRYAVDKLNEYPDTPNACKKVEQYTLDDEYIRTFDSIKEAFLHTNCNISSIGQVCRGLKESCCGYKWKFADEKEVE